eukprot:jgi/Ulvmu1/6455/UM003_0085.1
MTVKRRRIAPIAVDESAEAANPLPAVAVVTQHVNNSDVPAPEPGRRMWVSLSDGYDFNYRKLLQQKGARLADPFRQHEQGLHGSQKTTDGPSDGGNAASQEHGTQMLRAIQRIERRVQRERMVAVTGKDAVDSDEEKGEQAADGDDVEGAVQEEDDNNDKDEEGEEDKEETYQSTRGPKDQYDLNDDFIDDSEFIEAMEMRDERKLKHQGFFVNAGSVERVGEKVDVVAHYKPRKKRAPAEEGQQPKGRGSAASKAKSQAAAKAAAEPPPSAPVATTSLSSIPPGDPAPEPKRPSPARPAATRAPAESLSIAQQAIMMVQSSACDPVPAAPPGGRGGSGAAAPDSAAASRAHSTLPSPQIGVMRSRQLLSSSPPAAVPAWSNMGQSAGPEASAPSAEAVPDTRAASMDTSTGPGAGSDAAGCNPPVATAGLASDAPADSRPLSVTTAKVDMEAHANEILALPVDVPESESATLPGWTPSEEFRRALVELRAEAAVTPPPDELPPGQASKRKMPSNLAAKLELLTRPFYINAEEAANTNRAKKMLWGTMLPVLTTWSAEATIKTKMQKINSQIIGQYQLEKERFEGTAAWHAKSGVDSINHPDVGASIRNFIESKSRHDAVPLDSPKAPQALWEAAAQIWEATSGKAMSGKILMTLAERNS